MTFSFAAEAEAEGASAADGTTAQPGPGDAAGASRDFFVGCSGVSSTSRFLDLTGVATGRQH